MLRVPEEEERGGRYITMADESCGSIGSTGSREAVVDCERKATAGEAAEEFRCAPGEEGKGREGVGFKQMDWIPDLAQSRDFESDSKLDRYMGQLPLLKKKHGPVAVRAKSTNELRLDFFFSRWALSRLGIPVLS